jgi:tetratricopeptide (TPR) repeat protein
MGMACGCASSKHDFDADNALESGWNDYRLGEFNRAVATFERIIATTPEASEDHVQALYGLAATWSLRLPAQDQNKKLATDLYQRILAQAPDSEIAPWARLALARLNHLVAVGEDPDYPAVRAEYQQVMNLYPGHLAAREAFIYLMAIKVSTLETNELREAVAAMTEFVNRPGERSFLQPALSLLAVSYTALGMQKERLEVEIASLDATEVDPTNPFNEFSWQYWNIATIAEFELGDFETARKYYHKLLEEYPRDRKIYGVKVALKRMDDLEATLRAERR